jgi:hypothetical protein
MIQALRNIDRLYFGVNAGRGSATDTIFFLFTGFMPWAFVRRYMRGELDDEIARLCK